MQIKTRFSSNMNDDGFTDLIAPTHEMEASVLAFKTKEYDLRPNRTIQSRIHLLVQEMLCLIHGTCLCMAVAALLLVGSVVVLAVQIVTKVVEGFELMFAER
jgi:Na+/H+ antiporter NhaB